MEDIKYTIKFFVCGTMAILITLFLLIGQTSSECKPYAHGGSVLRLEGEHAYIYDNLSGDVWAITNDESVKTKFKEGDSIVIVFGQYDCEDVLIANKHMNVNSIETAEVSKNNDGSYLVHFGNDYYYTMESNYT